MANHRKSSPFLSRSYGGYSSDQIDFYRSFLDMSNKTNILDPMAGQAFDLSGVGVDGADITVFDINAACLVLADFRHLISKRTSLSLDEWFLEEMKTVRRRKSSKVNFDEAYCNDWISDSLFKFIKSYKRHFEIDDDLSPFTNSRGYWRLDEKKRYAVSMLVIASRALVSHTVSRNITWVKKGGALTGVNAADKLSEFVFIIRDSQKNIDITKYSHRDRFSPTTLNWVSPDLKFDKNVYDLVITSPPYANRLDYSVMWAPEIKILSALYNHDSTPLKRNILGSTVTKSVSINSKELDRLPSCAQLFLESVKEDDSYAGKSYYYPFFTNYLLNLSTSLKRMCEAGSDNANLVVFIRDTVRKSNKFDSESFVSNIMKENGFRYPPASISHKPKHHKIVTNHLGLRQNRERGNPVFGKAQVEWSLLYERDS